jgi:tRNA A37 threonylcarbamoyladenosine synthetase subunit TsaC/SUA5/YrdC
MAEIRESYDVKADASRVYEVLRRGGVAIVPYDIAYTMQSATDDALRRAYAAKQRSYDRASGIVGNGDIQEAVHILSDRDRRIIRSIAQDHNLPFSVIAPFRAEHPFMKALTPFLLQMGTKDGTVNFLLNAGPLRDEIAALSWEDRFPILASTANRSMRGTKYRLQDIEPEVVAAADITLDYGTARHAHPKGLSSTQIDFRTMKVVRWGLFFDRIAEIMRDEFGVMLEARPSHLHA